MLPQSSVHQMTSSSFGHHALACDHPVDFGKSTYVIRFLRNRMRFDAAARVGASNDHSSFGHHALAATQYGRLREVDYVIRFLRNRIALMLPQSRCIDSSSGLPWPRPLVDFGEVDLPSLSLSTLQPAVR